jgi:hypothetical protein
MSRGANQRLGGSSSGPGSGQGSAINRGGFHPGYAGCGPSLGYDNRYGGRGRLGIWPPFHHPTFIAQRARGYGADAPGSPGRAGAMMAVRDRSYQAQAELRKDSEIQPEQQGVGEGKQSQDCSLGGSAAAASGALNIGGKSFSIPEQAVVLL